MSAVADAVNQAKLRLERARARWSAVDVGVSTFKRFSEDDGGTLAAALTYYIFFSIFPLLLFAVAALGFVLRGNEELKADILNADDQLVKGDNKMRWRCTRAAARWSPSSTRSTGSITSPRRARSCRSEFARSAGWRSSPRRR